jgi:hypothetical protein
MLDRREQRSWKYDLLGSEHVYEGILYGELSRLWFESERRKLQCQRGRRELQHHPTRRERNWAKPWNRLLWYTADVRLSSNR